MTQYALLFIHIISVVKPVHIFMARSSFLKPFKGRALFPSLCALYNKLYIIMSIIIGQLKKAISCKETGDLILYLSNLLKIALFYV